MEKERNIYKENNKHIERIIHRKRNTGKENMDWHRKSLIDLQREWERQKQKEKEKESQREKKKSERDTMRERERERKRQRERKKW